MKLEGNKMIADEGYTFSNLEKTEVFSNIIYLGIYDSQTNYVEITIDEAKNILEVKAQEENN